MDASSHSLVRLGALALTLAAWLVSRATYAQPSADPAPTSPAAQPTAPQRLPTPTQQPSAAASSDPTSQPQEVLVVGTKLSRTAGAGRIIGEKQLERFEYDDPHAALQQVPGVYVRQEDGMGLRPNIGIRGVDPDRSQKVTLLEDGVLFGPAPYSAPAAYYFPLLTRMTRIRVLAGPSAIAYGPQTIGGAIDFVTRPIPDTPTASLDLGAGEYGYFKMHSYAGTTSENFGFLIEGVQLHNDGFKHLPSDANTGSTRREWMVKGSYVVDPRARVRNTFNIKLTYSDESSNETYLGLTDADFRADPYQRYPASALDRMDNHRTSIVLSHVLEAPSHHFHVTTQAYRHDFERSWRKINRIDGTAIAPVLQNPQDPNSPTNAEYVDVLRGNLDSATGSQALWIGPNQRTFVSQGIQSVAQLEQLATGPVSHNLELGVRLHQDSIERRHSEQAFDMVGGELIPVSGRAELVTAANKAQTLAFAAHMLDAIQWGNFSLTPGVRLEIIDGQLNDYLAGTKDRSLTTALMPGVGAFYSLAPELGFLAGVYRGFSAPLPGQEDAKPEYAWKYEVGTRANIQGLRAELIGFFSDYSNLTDVCTLSGGCVETNLDQQFNAGRAHIYGVETTASYRVALGAFAVPLSVAYTYTHAEFRDSFYTENTRWAGETRSVDGRLVNVLKGDDLPYVPRHQLNVIAGLEGPRFGASASLTYVAAMRERAGSGSYKADPGFITDDLLTLDISGQVNVLERLSVYANVRNLTDEVGIVGRRPYGARPNAPRWIQVGLKGKLD